MMKNILRHTVLGILIGSFVFLICLAITPIEVSTKNILSNFVLSALIGLISIIFSFDSINFFIELLIHYFGVLALVICYSVYNNWWYLVNMKRGAFLIEVTVIYVLIWLGLYLINVIDVHRLNAILKEKNDKKD